MKESNTLVCNAEINSIHSQIRLDTNWKYMKESNIHVYSAENNSLHTLHSQVLPNIKRQYIRESNTLAGNATINQVQREVLLNIKGQYMKESNTLAMQLSSKYKEKSARTSESSP